MTLFYSLPSRAPQAHEEASAAQRPADALLLRRLGIDTLPAHETLFLPLDRLVVSGADLIARSAARLVKSIEKVGVLQAPLVVCQNDVAVHDEAATFAVIAGRRRVLAARMAGLTMIKCEVYSGSTPSLSALITLIENEQRSAAWIKEVEALRHLIDEQVGMTLDDLAAFGFNRVSLSERLKMAQLPQPLVTLILAGKLTQEVVRKLLRLTRSQQERLAAHAASGNEITTEAVKQLLRAQIDRGLTPLQAALGTGWNAPHPTEEQWPAGALPLASSGPEQSMAMQTADGCAASRTGTTPGLSPLAQVLAALRTFEHSQDYHGLPPAVRTLTTALVQQLQLICQHTHVTELQKGETSHV